MPSSPPRKYRKAISMNNMASGPHVIYLEPDEPIPPGYHDEREVDAILADAASRRPQQQPKRQLSEREEYEAAAMRLAAKARAAAIRDGAEPERAMAVAAKMFHDTATGKACLWLANERAGNNGRSAFREFCRCYDREQGVTAAREAGAAAARAEFNGLVERKVAEGVHRHRAVSHVARRNSNLRRRMVADN